MKQTIQCIHFTELERTLNGRLVVGLRSRVLPVNFHRASCYGQYVRLSVCQTLVL